MPKQIVADSLWKSRIEVADRYYKQWDRLFKVNILNQYYEGRQWRNQAELGYDPYVINKIYEIIQVKIAKFLPTFPKYLVSAREGNEWNMEAAASSAQLKEDLLNQICSDSRIHYMDELEQAYKDSFFGFGMVESGYEADWILNPNAPKPLTQDQKDREKNNPKPWKVVEQPRELPQNERVYIKHIPCRTFRIGGQDHKYLSRCGWCGYYEYVDKNDLLALPKLMNRDKLEVVQTSDSDLEPDRESAVIDSVAYGFNSLKIWHIWDFRANNRLIILDSPTLTVFQRKFENLNLFDYRPDKRLITNGFYPIPPAFHWLSPQNEYNETREALRAHRRRFVRKFQVVEGRMDDEEIEKFETGPDGAIVKVKAPESITPVQNADAGSALKDSIVISADDLNRISGTTSEDTGVPDRTTATQANITNQRSIVRETKERDRLTDWFCQIGRSILLIVGQNFSGRVLVKLSAPEGTEDFAGAIQSRQAAWRYLTSDDIADGFDFKIDVDLTSLSQSEQEAQKKKLIEFTAYLTQFPMVAFSPYLVREAAVRIGFRNEKAIAEFQKMALLMEYARLAQLQAQAAAASQQTGIPLPENGTGGEQTIQQAAPPESAEVTNQITRAIPLAVQ